MNSINEIGNGKHSWIKGVVCICFVLLPTVLLFWNNHSIGCECPVLGWLRCDRSLSRMVVRWTNATSFWLSQRTSNRDCTVVSWDNGCGDRKCEFQVLHDLGQYATVGDIYLFFVLVSHAVRQVTWIYDYCCRELAFVLYVAFWALTTLENFGVLMWAFFAIIFFHNCDIRHSKALAWGCGVLAAITSTRPCRIGDFDHDGFCP